VDSRPARVRNGLAGRVDVVRVGPCERCNRDAGHRLSDRADALEVTRRRDRKAGLDHVHAEPLELCGDLRLFVRLERDARRLLAVAKGGVEDRDPAVGQRVSGQQMVPPRLVRSGDVPVVWSGRRVRCEARGRVLPLEGENRDDEKENRAARSLAEAGC
jgi:hypothetical protein